MAFSEEQAKSYIVKLLTAMSSAGGSDLFISKDFPPSMKLQGTMRPLINQKLSGEVARELALTRGLSVLDEKLVVLDLRGQRLTGG